MRKFPKSLRQNIKFIGDIERLISKVAVGKIMPREVMQLKRALDAIVPVKTECQHSPQMMHLKKIAEQLNPMHT